MVNANLALAILAAVEAATLGILVYVLTSHRGERADLIDRIQAPGVKDYVYLKKSAQQPQEAAPARPQDQAERFLQAKPWEADQRFAGKLIQFDVESGNMCINDDAAFEYEEVPLVYFMQQFRPDSY